MEKNMNTTPKAPTWGARIKKIFFGDGNRISPTASAVILILLLVIATTIANPDFLITSGNREIMIDRTVTLLMMGLGLTFVLLSGSVNLSVGGMISLNSILVATLSAHIGIWTIPVILLISFAEGLITGVIFMKFRIPSFIATYGMMGVYTSLAVLCSPTGSGVVVNKQLLDVLNVFKVEIIPGSGIKMLWAIALVIFLIFLFIQKRTAFGKQVAAIGNSPEAVRYSGLNMTRVKMICYGLSGLSTGIGALILCQASKTGDPTVGTPYLLLVVAVVIVGGTSLSGGSGGVFNTLLGALTIAIVENSLQMMGISTFYHQIIIGVIMILAVALSLDKDRVLIVK